MYNSTDREFIQKDPKAGNVYETLTQNGYIYCGDNPLYYIDPDGCSYISTLGNAGRTAFNVVKSGVAGGLGFYTRICCEIDNMPTWAKAAVGTTGIVVAGVSGVGAAAIAEAVIASAGISAATDGAFYSIYALNNGSFSKSELKDTVINGAANGYMFAGAGLGVAGIRNAAKSGKLAGVMADEAGSVSYEGGRNTKTLFRGDRASVVPDDVFQNGFKPKGTHNDALLHTKSNTTAGNFVSTSGDKTIATEFAGKNGYVYVLQTDNYVDINSTYGAGAYFPEQMEFSIPGGIKPSEIVGAYKKQDGKIIGDFISNLNFGGN